MPPLNDPGKVFDRNPAALFPSFHPRMTRDSDGPHRSQEDFAPSTGTCCTPHRHHRNNRASFHFQRKHRKQTQVDQRPQIASTISLSSLLTSSRSTTTTSSSSLSSTTHATTSKMLTNILQCSSCKPRLFILILLLSAHLSQAFSTQGGVFEVQLISLKNDRGLLENGSCCYGSRGVDGMCLGGCDVVFFICLGHFRANIPEIPECTFGSNVTNVYHHDDHDDLDSITYKLPFAFVWPGDFLLVIEAIHSSTRDSSQVTPTERERAGINETLVLKSTIRKELNISAEWTNEVSSNAYSTLRFRYRVICPENQFGPRCTITCIPRNDRLGHYQCKEDGSRTCLPWWTGEYCTDSFCDCENGECIGPNVCKCRDGWEGKRCDRCLTFPGCKHGSCNIPFQCICHTGWGGPNCNEDLNFCSNHQPCMNGGVCHNVRGSYACSCADGFSGNNCEIEIRDCRKNYQTCLNGGLCQFAEGEHKCTCSGEYEGKRCEQKKDWTCKDLPCSNNSTCVPEKSFNGVRHYRCLCAPGYTGVNCDENLNECNNNPCLNGGKCIDLVASFLCLCPAHFQGRHCERKSDCSNKPCLNGGVCKERQNGGGTKCDCQPGFSGELCQHKINHCLLNPCKNGATCEDHIHTFQCRCTPGYAGKYCDTKTDFCAGQPCLNGGTCSSSGDSHFCHCPQGYQGASCEIFTATHSAEGQHNFNKTNVSETGPRALHFVVALVLGIMLPLIVVGIIVITIWLVRRQRYMKKDREREKNELAMISQEGAENDINNSLNLNNMKFFDKSSQKMTPGEVNHFLNYKEDEGSQSHDHSDLGSTFQRNQLNLNKHRTRHKPPSANDSYAYQSKVPTKYKEINQDSWQIQKASRHTEV